MIRSIDIREPQRDAAASDPRHGPRPRPQSGPMPTRREVRPRAVDREVLRAAQGSGRVRGAPATARWGRQRLAADCVEALRETGVFGTVELSDLTELFASIRRARRALRELERDQLLRIERFQRGRRRLEAVTLTTRGRRLLERSVDPRAPGDEEAQAYLSGAARSAQVLHDTAVYRAARCEMRRLEAAGGLVERVRTERQLRRIALRELDAARRRGEPEHTARARVAAALDLTVTDGKLSFPDVRLEWQRCGAAAGAAGRVDLEVTTPDYRASSLGVKSVAGYQIYRMGADGRVSRQG